MAIDSVIHTNEQSISRVLQTGMPLALIFWTKNQAPSTAWESLLEKAAKEYAGKLLVAKVDAEAEATLRQQYQVTSLPSVVIVKQGKPEVVLDGQSNIETIAAWLRYAVFGGAQPAKPTNSATGGNVGQQTASSTDGHPITLTDANFDQIIQGKQPVLVDFWAPWCGPCRMVAPAVEQLAREFGGRAVVGKLNVDENPRTAQQYQIMGIPALYIFKRGQVVEQMVGVQLAAVLQQRLARHLN